MIQISSFGSNVLRLDSEGGSMRYLIVILLSLIITTNAAAECPADRDWSDELAAHQGYDDLQGKKVILKF